MTVTKLTVHKNQQDRRRAKDIAGNIRAVLREAQVVMGTGISGYAMVIWDENAQSLAYWAGTDTLHPCPIADYMANTIRKTQGQVYADEAVGPPPDEDA